MNMAAKAIMTELTSDIVLAYGDSDEYRCFPLHNTTLTLEFFVGEGL